MAEAREASARALRRIPAGSGWGLAWVIALHIGIGVAWLVYWIVRNFEAWFSLSGDPSPRWFNGVLLLSAICWFLGALGTAISWRRGWRWFWTLPLVWALVFFTVGEVVAWSHSPAAAQARRPTASERLALSKYGKIAFASTDEDVDEILVMNADGSSIRAVTGESGTEEDPAWSPDGRKIAFSRNIQVWVINADGGRERRLTSAGVSGEPAWSPDGTRIAFTSSRDGDDEIYVMNADGSGERRLTSNSDVDDLEPAWSPDGGKIAFRSNRDHFSWEIFVMNADGSGQMNLTNNPAGDSDPTWSPDGRIAFTRDGEIYVMNADGSGERSLTRNSVADGDAAWSPDGRKIVFASNRGEEGELSYEIYVMNADGTEQRRLTENSAFDCCPDWRRRPTR